VRLIDLTGQAFGQLTVIERGLTRKRVTYWTCRCECGRVLDVGAWHLGSGRRTSCGHVDPEIARGRRPWPAHPRYLVGDDGSIVGPSGYPLSAQPNTHGYPTVTIMVGGRPWTRPVHTIVCETFHGLRPDGHEAAHENGVRADCRAANLSWKTPAANSADKLRHGTLIYGLAHHKTKLSEDDVRAIRASCGVSQRALAARYGVSRRAVTFILSGQNWKHLP
jgi:hypothetical protein